MLFSPAFKKAPSLGALDEQLRAGPAGAGGMDAGGWRACAAELQIHKFIWEPQKKGV